MAFLIANQYPAIYVGRAINSGGYGIRARGGVNSGSGEALVINGDGVVGDVSVYAEHIYGDIIATNVNGGVRTFGNIRDYLRISGNVYGEVYINDYGGNININNVDGSINVNSVSGHIYVGDNVGEYVEISGNVGGSGII